MSCDGDEVKRKALNMHHTLAFSVDSVFCLCESLTSSLIYTLFATTQITNAIVAIRKRGHLTQQLINHIKVTVSAGFCNHERIEIRYGAHFICWRHASFERFEYFRVHKLGDSTIKVCFSCYVIAGVEDAYELLWMLYHVIIQGRYVLIPWINACTVH